MKKLILSMLALSFLISVMPLASAGIIWSLPSNVPFTIANSDYNFSFNLTVISPVDKTYNTKNIPLEVEATNSIKAYYSIDNGPIIPLGEGTHFSRALNVSNGNHNIVVFGVTSKEQRSVSVNFKVNTEVHKPSKINNNDSAEEEALKTPIYSEWKCINNVLQRSITVNGLTSKEYGEVCGLEIPASKNQSNIANTLPYLLISLILLILIIIAVIAIVLLWRKR